MSTTNNIISLNSDSVDDIRTKLLLKSLVVWLRIKFAFLMKHKFKPEHVVLSGKIYELEAMTKLAVVNLSDALLIERNAELFNAVASELLRKVLPIDIHAEYGSAKFVVNRRMNSVDICLLPPAFGAMHRTAMPCTMHILSDAGLIRNKHDKECIDIIPLLKQNISSFLIEADITFIDTAFTYYKKDELVTKHIETFNTMQLNESKNMTAVNDLMVASTVDHDMLRLVLSVYEQVENSYNHSVHVLKVKYHNPNNSEVVKDFSKEIRFMYPVDIEVLAAVLSKVINPVIKVRTKGNDVITFSTSSNDKAVIGGVTMVDDRNGVNDYFDMNIAPHINLEIVSKVIAAFDGEDVKEA